MSKLKYSGERFIPDQCDGETKIEHYQRYVFASSLVKDSVVLDAACGEGYGSFLLSKQAKKVIGLDIDKNSINEAKSKYKKKNIEYINGSVTKLPFEDDCFDIVVSFETIEHITASQQEKFLDEISRVLKPNGKLIMSTPNKAIYTDLVEGKNPYHKKEFYVNEYLIFLKRKFKYIDIFKQYPNTGYFLVRDGDSFSIEVLNKKKEESRYIVTICSNVKISNTKYTNNVEFDDSMYYFLNKRSHKLEKELLKNKITGDKFNDKLESSIKDQKEYIINLEKSVQDQKTYIKHLENDIKKYKKDISIYAKSLDNASKFQSQQENSINEQKQYIEHLENDIKQLKDYVSNLQDK